MKVYLTSGRCNPPLTHVIFCATMRYFENKREIRMYDNKGKVIASAIVDEWKEVKYINNNNEEHYIKRA